MIEFTQQDKDILANNTFSLKELEKTLNELRANSFDELYKLQKYSCKYKSFNLKFSDFKLHTKIDHDVSMYPRKYALYIDEDFISETKRLNYRQSTFFNKELSIFDISSNQIIFDFNFLVFIDGKLFDTLNILCKEDKTILILDINDGNNTTGVPKDFFDELMIKNADITVLFIPNCIYGVYNTNINVLQKYKDGLSLSRFNLSDNLDNETEYITFINHNNLLFGSVITDTTNSVDLLRFSDNTLNSFSNKLVHINIFGLKKLSDKITINGSERFFSLPIKDTPIPIENILIFKILNGVKFYAHNIKLRLYYPNIYEIMGNDNNEELEMLIFYDDDCSGKGLLKYKNELSMYYTFTNDILLKYKDYTIPDIIKNYKPFVYDDYSITNFEDYANYPDHFNYKIDKLKQWALKNSEALKVYLYNQIQKSSVYYIDVSKIDLNSKIRADNLSDITDINLHETFNEERYVFIFKNESKTNLQMRFFIDGRLYLPDKVYIDNGYEFFYIPSILVNSNSIIEIEKFFEYFFNRELTFSTIDIKYDIKLPEGETSVYKNDLFLVDKSNLSRYIDKSQYKISTIQNGTNIDLNDDTFYQLKDFGIQLLDQSLTGHSLELIVKKRAFVQKKAIHSAEDNLNPFTFNLDSINDKRHYRIFKNGQLVPTSYYNIDFDVHMSDVFFVGLDIVTNIGDELITDCTPNKYQEIHYTKDIPENGFIDLKGLIDEPIDLKWYDIYLNGLKLNKTNIDIISSTKFFIKNVNSTHNLYILKKNRDEEVFKLNYNAYDICDDLWSSLQEIRDAEFNIHPDIIDSLPDFLDVTIENLGSDLLRFYSNMMKYISINPDIQNVSDDWVKEFPSLFTTDKIFIVNPDQAPSAEFVMQINPDGV